MNTQGGASSGSSAYLDTFKAFVLLLALILASFYLLSSVILPIIISFTLYALIEPFTNYLVRKEVNHSLAIICILILMLALSIMAISFALPQLLEQVALLKGKLPLLFKQLEQFLTVYTLRLGEFIGVELNVSSILISLLSQSSSLGNKLLVAISEQVFAITLSLILVPLLTYFILKDYKLLRNRMMNWLPNAKFELGWLIYHRVTRQLETYIRGVMIQSLIMAAVASTGFLMIGLDIPLLLGILTGLLNLIPYLGPLISMALATLVAGAMTPFEPSMIMLALGVIAFAQLVDNIIVIPAVIANAVNLHPVTVIIGIIIFGNLFGTIGVILAIPALAAARIIYNNLYSNIYNASLNRE
ncbi:MAG: AI-2E family transporter [Gammaproteobacteria bacterium]|nr:AI-2E family transporter [Gammaproteobacteria bacterium]